MFCPNCGNQLDDSAKFCGGCGYNFASVPQPEETPQPETYAPEQNAYIPEAQPVLPEQPAYTPPPAAVPQPAQPAQPYAPAAVKSGPNPILVFLLTFILLGAIVASVMLFWKPGYLVNKDDSSSKSDSKKVSSKADDSDDDSDATATETKAPVTTAATEVTTQEPAETSAPTETEPPATEPPETETLPPETEPPTSSNVEPSSDARKYSTYENPTFDEFIWTVGQYGYLKDVPSSARRITDPSEILGGWKCFIYYNLSDGTMREINKVDISMDDEGEITFKISWYQAEWGEEGITDETDYDDEYFYGKMTDGKLEVNGVATVTIDNFWFDTSYQEGQYATGSIYTTDGEVYVALMRP